MKNKILFLKIFFSIFLIFFSNSAFSDELEFSASEILSYDKGNLIKGIGGVEINGAQGLIISGEKFEFDKLKSILKVTENVLIKDQLNKNLVKSNQIIFDKKLNTIISKNKTIIELNGGYILEGSSITYNRNLNTIFSNKKTLFSDLDNNRLDMNEFSFSLTKKTLIANNVKIKDIQGNEYYSKNIRYNLKTNEILGKDISMSFNSNNFNSSKNEPRLKGNSFFYKNNITQINKGVFTTCKRKDGCPPWVLSSEEIKHNKTKKTIHYKNAWFKIYDIPVVYFPRFFHPDPTVKRQSGFLTPGFSQSNNLGNYISSPYFHVISEADDFTFSPRIYDTGEAIYQGEYRSHKKKSEHIVDFSIKSKSALIANEKANSNMTHFFLNSKFDLNLDKFEQSKMKVKIQQTSDDDYLKTYKLKSPLIESKNNLHSIVNFNASREDLEVEITTEVYENLSLSSSNRYEYVYPSFSLLKSIYESNDGNLTLNSAGQSKRFNTNTTEKIFVNDFSYKSYNKISMLGVLSNYEVLLKNFNVKSKKSTTYKNKTENSLQSIINYEVKYPLQKISENFMSTLTPTFSARYSPNKSKNKSKQDRVINFDNIFSIDRIGSSDTVEGGQSITIGGEYGISNNKNLGEEIFSLNLATVFRNKKNDKLPINSTLGKKNSDIFGDLDFNLNKFIDFNYNFALDSNLQTINYNQIKSTLSFFNIVSTFDFLEKNNFIGSESYLSNETKFEINDSSSFSFKTRKNKDKDLTEYYNFIYEYKNDCLVAGIEFQKDFYSDGSLKPDEQLFFTITLMPFGKFNTPDIKK